MSQIELHKKISELLVNNPADIAKEEVLNLIPKDNKDAWQFFYSSADERWLNWLWDNGFLDVIKQKSEDSTRFSGWRVPELDYLVKTATKNPSGVVDIMLDPNVATKRENLNPGVVERFIWVCSTLPAKDLKRMVPEIKKQNWVPLVESSNDFGFEYEKMFKILEDAGDYDSIITLAQAVLTVRPKDEVKSEGYAGISTERPFYFNGLSYTKVFEYLTRVDGEHIRRALALVTKTIADVVNLGDDAGLDEVFKKQEMFHLYDVDFFSLELGDKQRLSHRDDVRQLAAVIKELMGKIKILADKTIGSYDTDPFSAKELYETYFKSLPDSRSMWRLQLYVLSLYPEYFKKELKDKFFKLFETMDAGKSYYDIIAGAEYERALKAGFHVLSPEEQREYVEKVISCFKKKHDERENDKENWHLRHGSEILSVLAEQLEADEGLNKLLEDAKKQGFIIRPEYEPGPSIKMGEFGTIVPQAPLTYEEFQKMEISEIADQLRGDLSPKALSEKYSKAEDFHRPINAEGVGGFLKKNIAERLQEYVNNSNKFFERNRLDEHYTDSFFRGIQEAIKSDKEKAKQVDWKNLIDLCVAIKRSGEDRSFDSKRRERETFGAWLAGWTSVHSSITDVLRDLIDGKPVINCELYRDDLFGVIGYLLHFPDPKPEDEQLKTAGMKSGIGEGQLVSDPFTLAINTVRGRAYQLFVMFVYKDSKELNEDVKKLYEEVLGRENTRALMFMFGHYLPSFYFRDKEWVKIDILPKVFPEDPEKKNFYLAAWEGFLANNLFGDMFFVEEIQSLYKRGIELADVELPEQEHFKEPDEGLAIHLALAFMFYKQFDFEHPLFKQFWANNDPEQHADFVSFIGRMFVSGSNNDVDELLKKEPHAKQRLIDLWDYLLKECNDTKVFEEMGFWINLEKDIFDLKWLAKHTKLTLEKTKGAISWEYGLMKSVEALAKSAPEDTLAIVRSYLLDGVVHGDQRRRAPLHIDHEWYGALQALYDNPSKEIKDGTYKLIDDLIREGGSHFWGLKKIIKDES